MRLCLLAVVALFVAPTLASATSDTPDDLAVTVLRIEGKGGYVSWSAAPGVVVYDVYRGPDLDHMSLLARTPNVAYTDATPLESNAWYEIRGQPNGAPINLDPVRGKCLMLRGATGLSVTVANCMPGDMPWP